MFAGCAGFGGGRLFEGEIQFLGLSNLCHDIGDGRFDDSVHDERDLERAISEAGNAVMTVRIRSDELIEAASFPALNSDLGLG